MMTDSTISSFEQADPVQPTATIAAMGAVAVMGATGAMEDTEATAGLTAQSRAGWPAAKAERVPHAVEVACRFACARRRPTVVCLLGGGQESEHSVDVPITRITLDYLERVLPEDPFDHLDLIVHSSGGDIHAAYQIMSLLRRHIKDGGELVACVPRRATSAATLLCLGADQLLLGESGTLGPLDAQIRMGTTPMGSPDYSSALHLLKGLDRLQQFSLDTFTQIAALLHEERDCEFGELLQYSVKFTQAITAPLFERIESHRVGYWEQSLLAGEAYGRRLLTIGRLIKRKPGDVERDEYTREEHIGRVVHRLVYGYESHETILDCDELANQLDLEASVMRPELQQIARLFASCSSETVIMTVFPPDIARLGKTGAVTDAKVVRLEDWPKIGSGGKALELTWDNEDGCCLLRVGLYCPPMRPGNPWLDLGSPSGNHRRPVWFFQPPPPGPNIWLCPPGWVNDNEQGAQADNENAPKP